MGAQKFVGLAQMAHSWLTYKSHKCDHLPNEACQNNGAADRTQESRTAGDNPQASGVASWRSAYSGKLIQLELERLFLNVTEVVFVVA
jgi:hypothetical protein